MEALSSLCFGFSVPCIGHDTDPQRVNHKGKQLLTESPSSSPMAQSSQTNTNTNTPAQHETKMTHPNLCRHGYQLDNHVYHQGGYHDYYYNAYQQPQQIAHQQYYNNAYYQYSQHAPQAYHAPYGHLPQHAPHQPYVHPPGTSHASRSLSSSSLSSLLQQESTESTKDAKSASFPGWSENLFYCLNELNQNYIFGKEIGRGTYSSVYEAKHRFIGNKIFAVKRTQYDNENERLRFIEENRLQTVYGQMTCYLCFDNNYQGHHEIISIWDCHSTLFSTLPFLSLFDSNTAKKERIVSKIVHKILQKLEYLHFDANIIHHDLKPENIIVTSNGNPLNDDFDVFIIDYGFSVFNHHFNGGDKYAQSDDKIMIPRYTFSYCSWELLNCINEKSIKYTQQIDVWALGIITMELLLNGENLLFSNGHRNRFIKEKTERVIKSRNIGEFERVNFEKEYTRFVRGLKVKYHRQYFLDENDENKQKSTISSYVVSKLKECGYSIECMHFVAKLLEDDPNKRLNANEALNHPFILQKY
eukprot:CAMPEP_0197042154 /NCGR_PEP_ID=MMETSP1384-20130603/18574_1 /TAXON_ID=29189 /ORGANISM="Ammonia sp." /LENGTH=527 /DNA_ID=CAMNT_0042473207 /DNA_START=323 /DNA_END=1906 /DNA_ORIENTATION=-